MSVYQPAVLVSRGNGLIDAVHPMKWIEKGSCIRFSTLLSGLLKGKLLNSRLRPVELGERRLQRQERTGKRTLKPSR